MILKNNLQESEKGYFFLLSESQYLLNQIVMLDWKPVLSPDQSPQKEIKKMLKNDGAGESMDVYNYTSLAALTENAQLIALKMQMEERDAHEDDHSPMMRRQPSEIC